MKTYKIEVHWNGQSMRVDVEADSPEQAQFRFLEEVDLWVEDDEPEED